MTIVSVLAKQNPFDRMISVGRRKKTRLKKKSGKQLCIICNWHGYELKCAYDIENLHKKAGMKSWFHSFLNLQTDSAQVILFT